VDLLVGSEGTLAFFVEIELDLIPVAAATSSVLGAFATLESAVKAATAARQAGAVACELLDRTFLDVAASGGAERQVPAETESALLAEVEASDARGAAVAAGAIEKIFRECGATTARVALDRRRRRSFGSCVTRQARFSPGSIQICARCNSSRTVRFRRRISRRTSAACARFSRRTRRAA
jgi:FAD/FMN-containing dehydrogenase